MSNKFGGPLATSCADPSLTEALRAPWREICAASIGNALEFYDLLIYGYFAIVIGHLFFPTHNAATSLLLSVGTFGISFLTRPLGAVVLGNYTDRAGRKASLTVSIALMMLATVMIVLTPSYEQIGLAAPVVVIIARLIQGFSSGGEFGAATAFMFEKADNGRRGFFSSWQMSSLGLATVLAAGVSAMLSACLTSEQINQWGWRAAFAFGLLIGPVGLYIRRNIDETVEFKRLGTLQKHKFPLREVLMHDRRNMLLGGGVVAAATAFNYVHKLYMPTYAVQELNISATSSFLGALVTGLLLMIASPFVGALADRYGHIKVMLVALVLIAASTYPLFVVLNMWPTVAVYLSVQAIVGLLLAATLGALPLLLADIFPTRTRGIGLAISYNFSVTLFGGFAPLIATWLIQATQSKLAPSFYVMGTAIISIIAVVALSSYMPATPAQRKAP